MTKETKPSETDRLIRLIEQLKREAFTGSIRIHFHKGAVSKKIEKVSIINEK